MVYCTLHCLSMGGGGVLNWEGNTLYRETQTFTRIRRAKICIFLFYFPIIRATVRQLLYWFGTLDCSFLKLFLAAAVALSGCSSNFSPSYSIGGDGHLGIIFLSLSLEASETNSKTQVFQRRLIFGRGSLSSSPFLAPSIQ